MYLDFGSIVTYFYVIYFAVLLVHRERRDDHKCSLKVRHDLSIHIIFVHQFSAYFSTAKTGKPIAKQCLTESFHTCTEGIFFFCQICIKFLKTNNEKKLCLDFFSSRPPLNGRCSYSLSFPWS
jgi:hypothetical protein